MSDLFIQPEFRPSRPTTNVAPRSLNPTVADTSTPGPQTAPSDAYIKSHDEKFGREKLFNEKDLEIMPMAAAGGSPNSPSTRFFA